LLSACKAEPDDDAARLVLADWLEEHGDEEDRDRAAFVRLAATSGQERGRPDFHRLLSKWMKDHIRNWTPFRSRIKNARLDGCNGLLSIAATHEGLCNRVARRWAGGEEWAWVEQVTVKPHWGQASELLASPLLDSVAHLTLYGADRHALAELAGLKRPPSVRGLALPALVPPSGLEGLLRSGFAEGLRSLRLTANGTWAGACEALGSPGALPELERLSLPDTDEELAAGAMFSSASWRLKALEIPAHALPPLAFAAMTRGGPCAGLRELRIGGGHLDCATLASARFWPTLEKLLLPGSHAASGMAALAGCKEAPRLRVLWMSFADMDATDVGRLAASPLCAALDALHLWNPRAGGMMAGVAQMPAAPRYLGLWSARLGDEGLEALAAWPALARCRVLNLAYNGITERGAAALAGSPYAAGLIGLSLYSNPICDKGLERLLKAEWACRLEELDVSDCRLTTRANEALLAAGLPALRELQANHKGLSALKEGLSHVPYVG
jgi:uncharacterized protein (TIGR02996 family)